MLEELCEEQAFLYIVPDNVQKRKNQRKIDNELQVLKEKLSTDSGKNVVLSNRELRLLRYFDSLKWKKYVVATFFVNLIYVSDI